MSVQRNVQTPASIMLATRSVAWISLADVQPEMATCPSLGVNGYYYSVASELGAGVEWTIWGSADGYGTEHDALDSGFENPMRAVKGADSATHLDGDFDGVDDAFDDGQVVGVAGAGAVEVHDVDAACAKALPAEGDFHRDRRRTRSSGSSLPGRGGRTCRQ